jgi:hypothetical protein
VKSEISIIENDRRKKMAGGNYADHSSVSGCRKGTTFISEVAAAFIVL